MKAGDYVLVETEDSKFEGVLMPRPEMLGSGIIVIKLDSGYNVGIDEKKVIKSSVLREHSKKVEVKVEVADNPNLPNVAVLSFGGTISSKIDYETGGTKAEYDANDFLQMCPELRTVANIKAKRVMQTMSEDLDLKTISKMAEAFVPYLEDDSIRGIVMTMGTDVLHYVAATLSFMIQNLNKPIVITASQRSIDRGSSDAFMNLSCAIKAAVSWNGAEVVTCLHGSSDDEYCYLISGVKVRKMHTSRRDAFRSINALPYAKVEYSPLSIVEIDDSYALRDSKRKFTLKNELSNDVALVYIYPGVNPGIIDYYVSKGYKAIVIAGTALGHVPTNGDSNMIPVLKKAIDSGLVVGIATQTLYGRVHPYVYTNLRKLSVMLGCVFGEDMTPETAYMKMCWLFGNYTDVSEIKAKFSSNLVGEIRPVLSNNNFLY